MIQSSRNRAESGSVMVEFALSLTFLITVFLGLSQFGFTFYRYSELESAVRDGARFSSLLTYDSATNTPSTAFLKDVQLMTVYGDPEADPSTATPLVPGLTTSNVNLIVTFSNNAPSAVTVQITGFQLPTYVGTVTLNGKPSVWYPYVGYFAPP
jgi:Flp pilus assembly protein TadG